MYGILVTTGHKPASKINQTSAQRKGGFKIVHILSERTNTDEEFTFNSVFSEFTTQVTFLTTITLLSHQHRKTSTDFHRVQKYI